MKTKAELTEELKAHSYSYEFVLNNLTEVQKRKLIEFLFKEKEFSDDLLFDISVETFKKVAILVFNEEGKIVALSSLQKVLIPHLNLHMFEFSYYVGKKFRVKGIRPSIIHKLLYPLSYYESQDYAKSYDMSEICGMYSIGANDKIINKHLKNNPVFNDGYWSTTLLKDKYYVWYYGS